MSTWARESARVIDQALRGLPPTASERECRAALRDAYPFGARRNHPYRMWCAAARRALEVRFGKKDREKPPVVEFTLAVRGKRLWLDVYCGWHAGTALTGCLMCARPQALLAGLLADPELRSLLRGGPGTEEVVGDWLEEQAGVRPRPAPPLPTQEAQP